MKRKSQQRLKGQLTEAQSNSQIRFDQMSEGISGLESPSYIYAAVIAMFLILSLIIEKTLHFVEHGLEKLDRNGLKVALNTIVSEVMMLGFISLLLTFLQDHISQICVPKFSHSGAWVTISSIPPCDQCLEHTRGLSDYYKETHQCNFWKAEETSTHQEEDPTGHHEPATTFPLQRRLLSSEMGDVCKEGKEVLVSGALLHEAHINIFMLTVIHVANVILMVLLANFQLRRFQKWKQQDDKYILCVSASLQEVTLQEPTPEDLGQTPGAEELESVPSTSQGDIESTPNIQRSSSFQLGGCILKILQEAPDIGQVTCSVKRGLQWQTEWVISFFKQFISPVTQKEFRIMRAAFMLEHRRSANFDFMRYLARALDDDICDVVKTPILGWVTLIAVFAFWSPLNRLECAFMILALVFVVSVLIISTKLVTVVRHVTREGRINKLTPSIFWFSDPKLLLPVMRYTLFINSAIFAVMAMLAITYGVHSCAFYEVEHERHLLSWSWGIILILNCFSFIHISFVMLPTYSLVVHMGSTHWSHHLIHPEVVSRLKHLKKAVQEKSKSVERNTST